MPACSEERLCQTVSKRIPASHVRGSGVLGLVCFGGVAWILGVPLPSFFVLLLWGLSGMVLLVPLVVLHEAAHWGAFRAFGAKNARFLWVMHKGVPVAPSVCGPGKWLRRWQYAVVIIAPTFVVSCAGVILMALVPVLRGPLAVALTLHLTGCVNDWHVFGSVVALPRGTCVEDRDSGFAYRAP